MFLSFKGSKKTLALAISALGMAFLATPNSASASEKYASIVIDAKSEQVLHARHADAPRYPASLTKVMTLYMVFGALKSGELTLDEELPVSYKAARQSPSKLALPTGSTIRVDDAINALVTKSANDVAVVIAERLGGSESRFAALMTVKARSLGMNDTRFYNASGLPDARQVTTARDMARLATSLLENHGAYYAYFENTRFTWKDRTYRNHNKLLGRVDGVDGIKTGYTRASGYNLIASAKRDDTRVIAVMLGGASSKARNAHVTDLLEAAFTAIEKTSPEAPDMRTRIAFGNVEAPKGGSTWAGFQIAQGDEGSKAD